MTSIPNGTMEYLDRAGHFLVDHQPELVTRLVKEFLLS
jgi:pimeloyl-ACP methyl ester carboxylesterase